MEDFLWGLKRGVRMRRTVLLLASMALALLMACGVAIIPLVDSEVRAQTTQQKPNIVYILTDDMRKSDLKYMPKTRSLLRDKGMTFTNAFVSHATCCPSRATTMRGQYAHNTGIWFNDGDLHGGWQGYKNRGHERDNLATRLDAAGYRTALFGKYLNRYENTTYVPPGWDRWFATFNHRYFNYDVNDNGTIRHFGTNDGAYQTDVIRTKTQAFIDASAATGKPFFAYVAPTAPHVPTIPAPRDLHTYDGAKAPRPSSFNERDVSDKPPWIRDLPKMSAKQIAEIDKHHESRVETLQAVDDLVAGVVKKLNSAGVMSKTYIFFTSDNGWHQGEHRIPNAKWRPYEETIRVPLLVRGPGVAAGSTTNELALNTDYLPTFTNLAGTETPSYVDGRSLHPVLKQTATSWRSSILLEAAKNSQRSPAYYGIRTVRTPTNSTHGKYIEYAGGVRELYWLGADPYELTNKYNAANPPSNLAKRLEALKGCAGDSCRSAEGP